MTAASIARELHGRRSGAGYVACCPSHDDRSPSLSLRDADGRVLVHCHAGCAQSDVIDALRARGLWPEREQRDWTPTERRDWGRQRREVERYLPEARYWRRAVLLLLESEMDREKSKLIDPLESEPDYDLIARFTRLTDRLRRAGDDALVRDYREWSAAMPRECAGLVHWARDRERAEVKALAAYLAAEVSE